MSIGDGNLFGIGINMDSSEVYNQETLLYEWHDSHITAHN